MSPELRATARLRVRPCPNSSGGISITVAPAARAISSERSRDPESITSSSTSPLTSWASTAASTSSR